MSILAERRDRLAADLSSRYGVATYVRGEEDILLTHSDYKRALDAVWRDRSIDAIGRGYYLGLGGDVNLVPVADWTCDPLSVSTARLLAVVIKPFRPLAAFLTKRLG